ncbi:hypothetical protein [Streptomyces bikiniensis]|uniref:hypothetical protein n=1 Tax=Streptomyces bikiniensis TaxID=1896 RepID=UPI0004BFFD91|nr:hypothetical protein [Streptomyces bikiniensis]
MEGSARRLAALVPALLCAIWSLILTPAASAPASVPVPASAPLPVSAPVSAQRLVPPEPHLAPAAVAGLPAVVEHSVRFPALPAAPAAAPVDLSLPLRGLLAGDPRRERAPPGGPHVPRDPRGPPSTRHS